MPRKNPIPENLESEVLARAGDGLTTRQVVAWLLEKHKIKTNHVTVGKMLRRLRQDRAEITRTVLEHKLAKTVTADIDRLEKHAAKLDQIATALAANMVDEDGTAGALLDDLIGKTPRANVLAGVVARLESVTQTKLKYSGAEGKSDDDSGPKPGILTVPESDD